MLNNSGRRVATQWPGTNFKPVAWGGSATIGIPEEKWTDGAASADFWAPRGYAGYVPAC